MSSSSIKQQHYSGKSTAFLAQAIVGSKPRLENRWNWGSTITQEWFGYLVSCIPQFHCLRFQVGHLGQQRVFMRVFRKQQIWRLEPNQLWSETFIVSTLSWPKLPIREIGNKCKLRKCIKPSVRTAHYLIEDETKVNKDISFAHLIQGRPFIQNK